MLLAHKNVLSKLSDVVRKIHVDSVGNEVSFECMPDNLDQVHSTAEYVLGKQSEPLLGSFMCRRTADCKVGVDYPQPCMQTYTDLLHRTGNQSCLNTLAFSMHILEVSTKMPDNISFSSSRVEDAI